MAGADAEAAAEAAAEAEAEAEAEAKAEAEAEAAAARERKRAPPPKRAPSVPKSASRSSRRAGAFVQLAEPPAEGKPAARAASGRRRPKDGAAARRRDGGTRSLRAVDEEAELPATPRRMEEWPEAGGAHVDI